MAKRRKRRRSASVGRRVSHARKAVNPRRRRRHARRRNPTVIVARTRRRSRRAAAPATRRRHHRRRHNPSALRVGQILKDMIYGAGGAILTRAGSSIAIEFVPAALTGNPLASPALQALIAVTVVRWGGKKFLGQQQGDIMMLGGLISAGLDAADKFLPNIQGQISGIVRAPVSVAPNVTQGQLAGYSDVYDVQGFDGLSDVYDVPNEINQGFPGSFSG